MPGLVARDSWLEKAIIERLSSQGLITPDLAVSKRLRETILRLSDAFTRERADLSKSYFDDEVNRLAYLASFVLTNEAKVTSCLEQSLGFLPKDGPISILDVGTGPGTAVFAASSLLYDRKVSFVALEKNRRILDEARSLEHLLPGNHSVEWMAGSFERVPNKKFDVAIAANVFNELRPTEQLKACKKLLSTSKSLIVLDPALKQTTRNLMTLRDQLLDGSLASVIAPCTHQKSCPMLAANKRDWCHFYIEWRRPKLIEAIDNATNLDHRYLKCAYLIFRATSPKPRVPDLWRVVSAPLKSRGKLELIVCGNGELKRLRRLDKNASETNSAFDRAKRGCIVSFTEKERPGEIRALDSFKITTALTPQPSGL